MTAQANLIPQLLQIHLNRLIHLNRQKRRRNCNQLPRNQLMLRCARDTARIWTLYG